MATPVFIKKDNLGGYFSHDGNEHEHVLIAGIKKKIARDGISEETEIWIAEVNKILEMQKDQHKSWKDRIRIFNHQFFNDSEHAVDVLQPKENCNKPLEPPAMLPSTERKAS